MRCRVQISSGNIRDRRDETQDGLPAVMATELTKCHYIDLTPRVPQKGLRTAVG
jgi:hypothetical protein